MVAGRRGHFQIAGQSRTGGLDLFAFDAALRCNNDLMRFDGHDIIEFTTIDTLVLDGSIQGALSVGPLLTDGHFATNPINYDLSLGSDPPFVDVPMVRLAVYESRDARIHIQLFDGRPESPTFTGVTPAETIAHIFADHEVVWGCFLNSGRTAKIATKSATGIMSYGNTHYLRWPKNPGDTYTWVPSAGRPVPSVITLQ